MTRLLLGIQGATTPGGGPGPWAAIALGVVTILYVVVIRPMRRGKARPDPLLRPPGKAGLSQQRAVERDMANLLVEYEEMIRRMTAQVDTRAAKLELLIRDAEEVIARLKAARADASGGLPVGPAIQTDATTGPNGGGGVGSPRVPVAGPEPVNAGRPIADSSDDEEPTDGRYCDVYRLADGGRSAREIARELDRPYGEIELILALRRDRPRAAGTRAEGPPAEPAATPGEAAIRPAGGPEGPAPTEAPGTAGPPDATEGGGEPDPAPPGHPEHPRDHAQGRRGRKKHRSQKP